MICFVDSSREHDILFLTDVRDMFACRIASLYESYGIGYSFVRYWIQYNGDGRVISVLSKYGDSITVFTTKDSELDEIAEFALMTGYSDIFCPEALSDLLPDDSRIDLKNTVTVVYGQGNKVRVPAVKCDEAVTGSASLTDLYAVLTACDGDGLKVPPYEDFALDLSHRIRHGMGTLRCVKYKGKLVCAAVTSSESNSAAIIGAVACDPEYRGMGFGTQCLASLCIELGNRTIFIVREKNRNEKFYNALL